MKVPQFRSFVEAGDYEALRRVFESRHIAEGPVAQEFRQELLRVTGAKYGCLACNGTLAIYMALKALGLRPGDEMIVQNTTFIATANAVEMAGGTPVFSDIISYDDLSLDLNKVKVTPKTRGIVVAHLFGTACSNIEEVVKFCRDRNLLLVEDAAQALGIKNASGHCGTFGDAGTLSFYADKTVTTGEGGAVLTNDAALDDKLAYLRNQGRKKSGTFIHPEIGYNFRLTDIQAALGLHQLGKMDEIAAYKRKVAGWYRKYLGDSVSFLKIREDFTYIPFRVVVFAEDAEKVMARLSAKEIEPRSVFYPLHRQPGYSWQNNQDADFKNSIECYRRGICLPTWVGLSEEEVKFVSDNVKEAVAGLKG